MALLRTLHVATRNLAAFAPRDRVHLRDPRGRSARPSLVGREDKDGHRLHARGSFLIRYDYTVSRSQGVRFVEVTGDENRIHRDGDIVAGALTASKIIVPLEILFPTLRLEAARIKFTGFCRYGQRTSTAFRCAMGDDNKVAIDVNVFHDGEVAAAAQVSGTRLAEAPTPARVKGRNVNAANLHRVQEYCHALGIDSRAYFRKGDCRDYTYPFGFVLSLPSAALVRQLKGQGGMLNVLTLELKDQEKIPITGKDLPVVRLQETGGRRSFRRILTDVIAGAVTFYKGSALVHPDAHPA